MRMSAHILHKLHESEIHVQGLVAVEKRIAGVIRDVGQQNA